MMVMLLLPSSEVEVEVAASTSAAASSEELLENIICVEVEVASASILTLSLTFDTFFAMLIVHLSLLGVR